MRTLPLYREAPRVPLQDAPPLAHDRACERCALHSFVPTGRRCVGAEGEPGGLLVVDSVVTSAEASSRRPLSTQAAVPFRRLLAAHWKGPVVLDVALRCSPPAGMKADKLVGPIAECRGYLAQTLAEARPTRILALGKHALHALTGRRLQPFEVRRGYTWLELPHGPVPVFFACSPLAAARNRFVREWFTADVVRALTTEPEVGPRRIGGDGVRLVETEAEALAAVAHLRGEGVGTVDCEWAGRPYDRDHRMLSVAVAPQPWRVGDPDAEWAYVWALPALESPAVLAPLLAYLRDPAAPKAGTYIKSDVVGVHSAWKVWTRGVVCDVRLARRLLDTEADGSLDVNAELVGRGGMKDELEDALTRAVAAIRRAATRNGGQVGALALPANLRADHAQRIADGAPKKRYGYAAVDRDLLSRYNASDAVTTSHLAALVDRDLAARDPGLRAVWEKVVLPAGNTFARIEAWGIAADRGAIQQFGRYLTTRLDEVRAKLAAHVPADFDPGNTNHVRAFLFDPPPAGLGLVPLEHTATGLAKADADTLEAIAPAHPVARLLLQWRQLATMKARYADGTDGDGGLLAHVRDDGRIHPTIHPDGADTGRTSSSDPNLQNIPSMEASDPTAKRLATMLRNCFTATPRGRDGLRWFLAEFDYSQIELRIAADQSGDQNMIQIFRDGLDYHRRSAQLLSRDVWNIAPDQVNDDHRREIKPVNFQLLYDDDPASIAYNLTVTTGKRWSTAKVAKIKDAIFGNFPGLAAFIRERVKATAQRGTMRTWWDGQDARERSLWQVADVDERAARTARRGSWNGPIQGTANDYLVDAARRITAWVLDEGLPAKVVLTVHDSLMLDAREDVLVEVFTEVPRLMCSAPMRNGTPLAADGKAGPSWGSMTKVKTSADLDAILRAT